MSGSFVYINSIIVASTSIAGFCIIGCLINRIEKRKLFGETVSSVMKQF